MISLYTKLFNSKLNLPILSNLSRIKYATVSPVQTITPQNKGIINTNVIKDVILFSYENPKFFKIMNICAICQYMFWCYFGHFCFTEMRDVPVEKKAITEDTPWYMKINLGENKYKNTLGVSALIIGFGTLALSWMYTLRSVRYLILNKGGNAVSFVTYTPFGPNRIMKVDLKYVSSYSSRHGSRVHLPIKVYRKYWFYLLDMRGAFRNQTLFDHTAGIHRSFDFARK